MGKPVVNLIGEDGNVFNIIGKVSSALRQEGKEGEAEEFKEKAFSKGSYDEVIQLVMDYVKIR